MITKSELNKYFQINIRFIYYSTHSRKIIVRSHENFYPPLLHLRRLKQSSPDSVTGSGYAENKSNAHVCTEVHCFINTSDFYLFTQVCYRIPAAFDAKIRDHSIYRLACVTREGFCRRGKKKDYVCCATPRAAPHNTLPYSRR